MKVLIPVIDSTDHRYIIADGIHESGSICILDTTEGHITWYETKDYPVNERDLFEELKVNGITNIIASSLAPMAIKVFNSNGFTIYKSVNTDLLMNLELLKMRCLPNYSYEASLEGIKSCSASSCQSCHSTACSN
jgi:predicted Fe-Mo cluster-binding NifX family protein